MIYGTRAGVNIPNHQWLYQNLVIEEGISLGQLVGETSDNTYFGWAITTADLDNDGYEEPVIGVPGYSWQGRMTKLVPSTSLTVLPPAW